MKLHLYLLFSFFLLSSRLYSGNAEAPVTGYQETGKPALAVFNHLETGLKNGNPTVIAEYFSSQNFLSLGAMGSGYYSASQAYYILQDFFKINTPLNFKITVQNGGGNPYATGVLTVETKGKRKSLQVFISLKQDGADWKISQLTIR